MKRLYALVLLVVCGCGEYPFIPCVPCGGSTGGAVVYGGSTGSGGTSTGGTSHSGGTSAPSGGASNSGGTAGSGGSGGSSTTPSYACPEFHSPCYDQLIGDSGALTVGQAWRQSQSRYCQKVAATGCYPYGGDSFYSGFMACCQNEQLRNCAQPALGLNWIECQARSAYECLAGVVVGSPSCGPQP